MISIKHLKKSYSQITPLKDVNVDIHKGDVVSIIGPSGTGKSTLLRCINMLDAPTDGHIFIDGEDVTDKKTDLRKVRLKMGMVFQSFNLFSHKMVLENVMMGPMDLQGVSRKEAFEQGVKYLNMVGLGSHLYAYPDELSGGQKQRVAIARCLAMHPDILLFDEPTSALDPAKVGEVQAVIRNLAKEGHTMMVVTHDMKFSREIANRVFYMDEGIVYEEGTPDEIFDNPKKERTRAFVKRLKTYEYTIDSKDFDFYEMLGGLEAFGREQFMTAMQVRNMNLVLEELIMHNILPHTEDINISVSYYEEEKCIEMNLDFGGESLNPFDTEQEDILSMLIARQLAEDVSHSFDKRNILHFRLVSDKKNI